MQSRFYQFLSLSLFFVLMFSSASLAAILGPAETIDDLRAMIDEARTNDTLLISGEIIMDDNLPLTTHFPIRISSETGETGSLNNLRLQDASITFTNVLFDDSLSITGTSSICLSSGVHILGHEDENALSFIGNGALIVEPNCQITAGPGSDGIFISHTGGEFYASIEGIVYGGPGQNGGAGVIISPLLDSSAVLISGSIEGGSGIALGGHALDLYNLSGNAFITIDGTLTGGSGFIGGDAIQIISANNSVSVGIGGRIKGGSGQSHGGCALILMNTTESSSFNLTGSLSGGDAIGASAQPGTSLQLVGNNAVVRTRIDDCILEDGRYLSSTPKPDATIRPLPTPTASPAPTPTAKIVAKVTPMPEITSPADHVAYIIPPESPAEPSRYHTNKSK